MIIPNRPRALRFLARTSPSLVLLGLAAAATTAAVPASASIVASPVVGYTYVDGNTAPANIIDGFARHADGSLTPLAGTPFSAGGAGLASQGAIQVTPDGKYLLAVDAGSNEISVLRITAGGVPVLVGQPVPSGGITPVSVAVSRSGLVYVANQGNGGSGYSGFRLHSGRSLTPVAGSTVRVPDGSGLGDVFFNAFGNHLIGTRTGTSLIDSFVVRPGGRLLAAHGSPLPARASASSAPSSRPPGPPSYLSATRTTAPASVRSRPTATPFLVISPPSDPRPSLTGRPHRAGSRSATTARTSSPSTPARALSPATPSSGTAPSSWSAAS
jgi:hypothetical protein